MTYKNFTVLTKDLIIQNRHINLKIAPKHFEFVSDNYSVIELSVYYELGSMNYFSGSTNQRGVYVSVTPIHETIIAGSRIRTMSLLGDNSGLKHLLEPMNRYNANKLFNNLEAGIKWVDDNFENIVSQWTCLKPVDVTT